MMMVLMMVVMTMTMLLKMIMVAVWMQLQRRFAAGHLKGRVNMPQLVAKAAQRRIVPTNLEDALTSKRDAIQASAAPEDPEPSALVVPHLPGSI
jgi:hypothetical protein